MESVEIEVITSPAKTPKIRQNLKIVLLVCSIYLAGLLGVLCLLMLIPSSPADSEMYKTLYFTSSFEPFKIFYYAVLLISSQIYVSSVTLKYYIKMIELDQGNKFNSILYYFLGFLIFLLGPNATLRAVDEDYSYTHALVYNYCCYTLPFVLALHSTYIYSGTLIKVSILNTDIWKWSYKSWGYIVVILAILLGLLGYQFYILYLYSRIIVYSVIYAVVLITGYILLRLIRRKYYVNDYFLVLMLAIPLTATPSIPSALLQGCLLGMYVEGVNRVGFDKIFIKV